MAIILEGFDNSGKSTLAKSLGRSVLHPGPRPKTTKEVETCLAMQWLQMNGSAVMDRVTAISMPAYGEGLPEFLGAYFDWMKKSLEQTKSILVYCRPPTSVILNFANHEVKPYDEADKLRWLQENAPRIIQNYDEIMQYLPHVRYDWTNVYSIGALYAKLQCE